MTIHKCQGMTLDRARIDLGKSEISTGMSFVALSRVKRLDGLLFVNGSTTERLASYARHTPTRQKVVLDERRTRDLLFILDPIPNPIAIVDPNIVPAP
jgi:ATP-dependent DNA helicase PIF1